MELRAYWAIIKRRFWIIAPIIVVVAIYAAYQYYHLYKTPEALKAYQSSITMRIGLQAAPHNTDQNYADYLSVSETLADVIVTAPVINSQTFATEVSHRIQSDMGQITQRYGSNPNLGDWQNPAAISAAVSAARIHNLVTVTVNWSTPAGAWAIAHAIGEVSTSHLGTYLDYEVRSPSNATAHPVVSAQIVSDASDAALVAGPAANKPALLLALLLVACIVALALAFLVEYLDDRIRSKDEVEQLLQLPCFGEIPPAPTPGKHTPRSLSIS
jgi:capsular polysaccharide biosynthesis protein